MLERGLRKAQLVFIGLLPDRERLRLPIHVVVWRLHPNRWYGLMATGDTGSRA